MSINGRNSYRKGTLWWSVPVPWPPGDFPYTNFGGRDLDFPCTNFSFGGVGVWEFFLMPLEIIAENNFACNDSCTSLCFGIEILM